MCKQKASKPPLAAPTGVASGGTLWEHVTGDGWARAREDGIRAPLAAVCAASARRRGGNPANPSLAARVRAQARGPPAPPPPRREKTDRWPPHFPRSARHGTPLVAVTRIVSPTASSAPARPHAGA